MITRVSMAGLVLTGLGLLIVIVHALNMSHLYGENSLLPELGIILVGMAVQLLGLGLVLAGKSDKTKE